MNNYKTKVISICLTTVLLAWSPLSQAVGGVTLTSLNLSKILPYNFYLRSIQFGRSNPVQLTLIKTSQAMVNPDNCTRADYYQVTNEGRFGDFESAPGMTIEQLTTIKINSLPVDLRLNGCSTNGFPIVRWIEF